MTFHTGLSVAVLIAGVALVVGLQCPENEALFDTDDKYIFKSKPARCTVGDICLGLFTRRKSKGGRNSVVETCWTMARYADLYHPTVSRGDLPACEHLERNGEDLVACVCETSGCADAADWTRLSRDVSSSRLANLSLPNAAHRRRLLDAIRANDSAYMRPGTHMNKLSCPKSTTTFDKDENIRMKAGGASTCEDGNECMVVFRKTAFLDLPAYVSTEHETYMGFFKDTIAVKQMCYNNTININLWGCFFLEETITDTVFTQFRQRQRSIMCLCAAPGCGVGDYGGIGNATHRQSRRRYGLPDQAARQRMIDAGRDWKGPLGEWVTPSAPRVTPSGNAWTPPKEDRKSEGGAGGQEGDGDDGNRKPKVRFIDSAATATGVGGLVITSATVVAFLLPSTHL